MSGRRGYAATVRELADAQKSTAGVPAYLRYVNRPLGRRVAALAHLAGLTPNHVTALSAGVTVLGLIALVVLPPSPVLGIMVAVALATGYVLDSADGQLARLRGTGSLAGEWLDHVVDAVRMPAVHLCTAVALYLAADVPDGYLLVPLAFALLASVLFFSATLVGQLRQRTPGADEHQRQDGTVASSSVTRSVFLQPVDFSTTCWLFVLWGLPAAFQVGYAALLAVNTGYLLLTLVRKYRELRHATG